MKRTIFSLLIAIVLLLALSPVANAADSPESIVISNVAVFRNLAESGDVLIMFQYDMTYPSDNYTDVPASRGIMLRLIDTDGSTVLQTDSPYVYPYFDTNGYGDGVGAFYFAGSENYTWNSATTINIITCEGILSPQITSSKELTDSDYSLETTQAGNRDELSQYVLLVCDDLESIYSDTGIVLKSTGDDGLILSPYGEAYFQGVVIGMADLCPELFFIQSSVPEVLPTSTYNLSYGDAIAARTDADDMGEGFTNMAALFHMGKYAFWLVITAVLTVIFCVFTIRREWGIEPGLLLGGLVFTTLAFIIGGMVFGALMLMSFVCVIGLVWILLLKRA